MPFDSTLPLRIWKSLHATDTGCWLWMGYREAQGYGVVWFNGRPRKTHRVVYQALRGPVPADLTLDHLCRTRACANPLHLEPVTQGVNTLRGFGACANNARKTHCLRGHELTAENTMITNRGRSRRCRTCRRADSRLWEKKRVRNRAP